ncbi:MAG: NAD(+) synthase, partial [Bacilli bacterium]|nr:NAD(+) synthase [Bacilli bacterium]
MIDIEKETNRLIAWIRQTVGDAKVVIGISGGKDSSVAAAACVAALGKDRVIGVMMPDGVQHDIDKAKMLIDFLEIPHYLINLKTITDAFKESISSNVDPNLTYQMRSNLASRCRMTTLYNVAAMLGNCRVVNTGNASEAYVGYCTKYGDASGDFSPLGGLLLHEVKALGYALGLPQELIEKAPEDGLSGKTDEENFGFTYA